MQVASIICSLSPFSMKILNLEIVKLILEEKVEKLFDKPFKKTVNKDTFILIYN